MKRVFAAAFAALLLIVLLPRTARADSVTDTLTIGVGYFGWSEDQYIEKATYHWTELDDWAGGALDTHLVIYSYYSGARTYLVAARGFYIRDLLYYAGIDFGSISSIDFFTRDHSNGAYRSFSRYSLLNMPRYYFPNLAANEETGEIYPYDGDDIWNGASQVEAMMALEDYTEWDVPGAEFEQLYDPAMLNPNARFHLFFGQSRPDEASTSSAAKYCYKLLVTFAGTPVLGADETDMELKIGSARKIELTVDAEDGLLNDYVRDNIVWSSSDPAVVAVGADGTVTVLSEGEAVVTASFGESSVSINVRVSADAEPTTSGGGNGSGEG
ncbi:MAG: Ig-like domain-containing protein, partial [Oscillospiraceae bacterium]|nr:Ig-like domain-containing protein [Oscillospiraceae bacterium]